MKKTITLLLCVTLIAGCATRGSNYIPVVDLKNKNSVNYRVNLSECQTFAKKRMGAGEGALLGIFAGIVAAAITGTSNRGRNRAIALGATTGAYSNNETQESIIKKCLRGRGYIVLN